MSRTKGSFVRTRSLIREEESRERAAKRMRNHANEMGSFAWNNHTNEDPFARMDDKNEGTPSHRSIRVKEGHSNEPPVRTKNNPKQLSVERHVSTQHHIENSLRNSRATHIRVTYHSLTQDILVDHRRGGGLAAEPWLYVCPIHKLASMIWDGVSNDVQANALV
ncbi:hypothetical protein E3N88_04201 [Mikania micrantha]|uniref:Uncharacterized protein n=1 Tax=Mikania micrantha TaxID=192012 RepID=A0A5N6PUP6_9ASTR|nr:hypothetical protein E3N88_04201 [Mikania micrantha]